MVQFGLHFKTYNDVGLGNLAFHSGRIIGESVSMRMRGRYRQDTDITRAIMRFDPREDFPCKANIFSKSNGQLYLFMTIPNTSLEEPEPFDAVMPDGKKVQVTLFPEGIGTFLTFLLDD